MPPLRDAFARTTGSRTCPSLGGDPVLPRIRSRSVHMIASLPVAGCHSGGLDTPRHPSLCTPDCGCCTAGTTARGSLASYSPRSGRGGRRPASPASFWFQGAKSRACCSGGRGARQGLSGPTGLPGARGCRATCVRADDRARRASGISQGFLCGARRMCKSGSSISRLARAGGGIQCRSLRRSKAVQAPLNHTKSGVC